MVASPCTSKENHEEERDDQLARGHWSNSCDFFVSCLGYAVGLGNVWRFPLLCFQYGGGSFLIPYAIMLFAAGLPVFFLEIALGQYAGVGPIKIFGRLVPLLRGLGFALVNVSLLLAFFYIVVVAWSIWYLAASFNLTLEWSNCDHEYNSENCFSWENEQTCQSESNGTMWFLKQCVTPEEICQFFHMTEVVSAGEITCANDTMSNVSIHNLMSRVTSEEEYWERHVLAHVGHDWNNFGTPRIYAVATLFCAWFLVAVCLLRGVKWSGKVVYFTSLFPYIILIILGARGFSLPGATDGILAFLTPKWNTLLHLDIWVDAATQIIFSLGPACGCVITLSSYNKFERNCHRDAVLVAIANCATSLFSGLVVFAIIGFMAHDSGVDVLHVVRGGPGLAFIAYPAVITRMAGSNVFAALFFIMLITLALGSIFGAFETVISATCDQFQELRAYKPCLVILTSSIMFLFGLIFTCGGGIHMFTLFNASAPSWNLLMFALFEVVVIGWLYGAEPFLDNCREMGMTFHPILKMYWKIAWKYLTPVVLTALLCMAWVDFGHVSYNNLDKVYVYPTSVQILGYLITACTLIWIPVFGIVEIFRKEYQNDKMVLLKPTHEWSGQQMSSSVTEVQPKKTREQALESTTQP